MKNTQQLKKTVRKYYKTLERLFSAELTGDERLNWLTDNKNRILDICASVIREIPSLDLPAGFEYPRVAELADEIVLNTNGNINEETVTVTERFCLTDGEFAFLPTALKISLLGEVIKILNEPRLYAEIAPNTVRSLILFNDIDFIRLRSICLKQEQLLIKDRVYSMSDEATKAIYRNRVSKLAHKSGRSEEEIAQKLLEYQNGDVTDNLFGRNKEFFAQSIGVNETEKNVKLRLALYVLSITALSVVASSLAFALPVIPALRILLSAVAFVPCFVFFQNIVMRAVMRRLKPQRAMRLKKEFVDTAENKTAVILTVLVQDVKSAGKALTTVEEYFSGNRLDNGVYGIVADLFSHTSAVHPKDREITEALKNGIEALNEKYGNRFFVLVRDRQQRDGIFCGWERKRGAIEQLVRYISYNETLFPYAVNAQALDGVKYICTLDGDTVMPPGAVAKLLGVIAHPANKKCGSYFTQRGYGLVQPGIRTLSKNVTPFSKITGPASGFDAYNTISGELYNDLFFSGTFCGKGIFSVEAYKERVEGKIRPNTVLSHDLLEGELIATLGVNDVSFFDEFPQTALAYYKRRERWLRGDWQLLPWLFSKLSAVAKWKIFYNLLQALFPVGVMLKVMIAPFYGAWAYLIWASALIELIMPMLFAYSDSLRFDKERNAFSDNKGVRQNSIKRSMLNILFLPYEGLSGIVIMVKALWRRLISHKKVLEWSTFQQQSQRSTKKEIFWFFIPAVIPAGLLLAACICNGTGIFIGGCLMLLWAALPYIAYKLSIAEKGEDARLTMEETDSLKLLAMRTLRFFYEALYDNAHFMPDNLQLKPYKGYAMRTSPTNIGFGLLSVVCGLKLNAYCPGYCAKEINAQLNVIDQLEKFRGHLYNWYSLDKKPLSRYVSTVDSGNLLASLITVKESLQLIRRKQIFTKTECIGMAEAIYSGLDGAPEDFSVRLREYGDEFYSLTGDEAYKKAKEFISDGIIASCTAAEFPINIIKNWVEDYEALSFPKEIFDRIDKTGEFNLRPLKDYLKGFPVSIGETLEISDFDKHTEELVWALGREKYHTLLKDIRNRFRQIYNYAYKIEHMLKNAENTIDKLLEETDLLCLYNNKKNLFAIGIDGKTNKQSINCYDMLCSEARLTSYIAIAFGKIPASHWFDLGRPFTRIDDCPVCLSWSGTMFEYLMPDIFIKPPENTMLYNTSLYAVRAQMKFTARNGIWGVSESAFNKLDTSKEYKYKAFGIKETALASNKSERVFSPYSTLLAFEYAPKECMENVVRLVENGCAGIYGMFEAIDYKHCVGNTPGIVYSHMAHHSGMGLCALVNYLYNGAIRKTFLKNSFISAARVLLEEKMPVGVIKRKELPAYDEPVKPETGFLRDFIMPHKQGEELLVLSGGDLSIEVSSRGTIKIYNGRIFIGEAYIYLQDTKTSGFSYLPVREEKEYKTVFRPESATFSFTEGSVSGQLEIFALENSLNAYFKVNVTNKSGQTVHKKVIFVLRPVLDEKHNYLAHPGFNGLFAESELKENAVIMKNRKTERECGLWVFGNDQLTFNTDLADVIYRGGGFEKIKDFDNKHKRYPITPVIACSIGITLDAGGTEQVDMLLLTRQDGVQSITNKAALSVATENARLNALSDINAFDITNEEWLLSLKLAALKDNCFRGENCCAAPELLWQYSVDTAQSVLLILNKSENPQSRLKTVLKCCDLLIMHGFLMQVLVIDDTVEDYLDGAFSQTDKLIKSLYSAFGMHHVKKAGISDENLKKIKAMSFACIDTEYDISEQLQRVKPYVERTAVRPEDNPYPLSCDDDIPGTFDSGYGRFINGGKEYYIYARTPMPWSNVIANPHFGTLTTESGGGYVWAGNSSINKLTPWYNDAVSDPVGEALYLRDNKLKQYWCITRSPIDKGDRYSTVFGRGYTVYGYNGFGLKQTQTVFVHKNLPIKIISVDIDNIHERDITCFYCLKPVMGQNENEAYKYTHTFIKDGILCTKRNDEYMFIYAKDAEYQDNLYAFIGNDTLSGAQAVREGDFVKATCRKSGMCLKLKAQKHFDIFIGYAQSYDELLKLKATAEEADTAAWLQQVKDHWDDVLGSIQIETPDEQLNTLFNNWLLYQTVASRLLARCGFYQAGGAYGFRDQLQDCLALIISQPEFVKEHILKCAAHQFKAGDVQHWWHEPFTGVRTRISDDLLFLPYVAAKYWAATGDESIFDVQVPFLEGHSLGERDDLYEAAWPSKETGSLYEHCMRAMKLVILRSGKHGLPLMLGGDWNDGMNGLGKKGKGESVWLGWFFYGVISEFLPICKKRSESDAALLTKKAKELYNALNTVCWDGEWYLRAFDDSGRLIGSKTSECAKIDAISQSWAVLSGAGKAEMVEKAMHSLEKHLVDRDTGIIKLLTPPISKQFNAGYIGQYIPGVRENGGQYTHGAIWAASAFLQYGQSEKGYELLSMINPINHTLNKSSTERYKLEPFSVAADVYSNEENNGRGGWSWYTASSALYYSTVLKDLLGIEIKNGNVSVDPHIPPSWKEFSVKLDTPTYKYDIRVLNPLNKSYSVSNISKVEKNGKTEIRVVM